MEKVFFELINNKKVFCILSEPDEDVDKKMVIISHGFRGSSLGPARQFVDFQKILNNAGFSVLRFDQPNGGNSEGDYLDVSFNEWVATTFYFTKKYLNKGYKIALLGQSMGGTVAGVVASKKELAGKVFCILLWVPGVYDPKYKIQREKIYEEAGQKYRGKFWLEAKEANFPECLYDYQGNIHLVYGEEDKFVTKKLRQKVVNVVKKKNQDSMILKGQDHSPWDFDFAQKVYKQELNILNKD